MAERKVVIIDYGSGNLKSVYNAFDALGVCDSIVISNDLDELRSASHIILPGVGAFADCMGGITAKRGLLEEIRIQALELKKPFLGICAGMQVLADIGYEKGVTKGLGLIPGEVRNISDSENFDKNNYKIPQIGWNNLKILQNHPIVSGIGDKEDVYFANSYRFIVKEERSLLATVDYGCEVSAIIAKNNVLGMQFHPEKSGEVGLRFLRNFILN